MRPLNISRPLVLTLLAATAAVALLFLSQPLNDPPYSPDSWSYYELSRSVFSGDFYRVSTFRQFEFDTLQGASFPPLWPVLVALTNQVAHLGPLAGYLLNFFIAVGLLFGLTAFFRRRLGAWAWPLGVIAFVLTIGDCYFLDELLGARTIPLANLLALGLFAAWTVPTDSRAYRQARPWLTGLLAGLMAMNRFDFLLAGASVALLYLLEKRPWRERLTAAAAHLLLFLLILSPWIAYSYAHFGRLFVTDNARTVLTVQPIHVSEFHPGPLATLVTAPGAWLATKAGHILSMMLRLGARFMLTLGPLLLVGLFALRRCLRDRQWCQKLANQPETGFLRRLFPLLLVFAVQLVSISLTGYSDWRYLSTVLLLLAVMALAQVTALTRLIVPDGWLWLVGWGAIGGWLILYPLESIPLAIAAYWLLRMFGQRPLAPFRQLCSKKLNIKKSQSRALKLGATAVSFVILVIAGYVLYVGPAPSTDQIPGVGQNSAPIELTDSALSACLWAEPEFASPGLRLLALHDRAEDAYRFGAVSDWPVITRPHNLYDPGIFDDLVDKYLITDVVVSQPSRLPQSNRFQLERVTSCPLPLYRVKR